MQPHHHLIHKLVHELWNERRLEIAKEIFTADITIQAMRQTITGLDEFEYVYNQFIHAIPDLHYEVGRIIKEGNYISFKWRATGTFTNDFTNLTATKKPCDHWGISMLEVDGNRIERLDRISNIWVVETLWSDLHGT